MSTSVTLSHDGVCSFTFENEDKVKSTYTFEDSDDMMYIGLSLIKNSLISKLMVENEQVDDPNETIREFVEQISEEIYSDSTFYSDIEEHKIDSDDSDIESDDESTITEDEDVEDVEELTTSMQKVITTSDE